MLFPDGILRFSEFLSNISTSNQKFPTGNLQGTNKFPPNCRLAEHPLEENYFTCCIQKTRTLSMTCFVIVMQTLPSDFSPFMKFGSLGIVGQSLSYEFRQTYPNNMNTTVTMSHRMSLFQRSSKTPTLALVY